MPLAKKKSKSETGHAKTITSLEELIVNCIDLGALYNPSKEELQISFLQQLHAEGRMSLDQLIDMVSEEDIAINNRKILFADLTPFSTRVINALAANGASAQTVEDAKGILRKIRGLRAGKPEESNDTNSEAETTTDSSETPQDNGATTPSKSHSSSQQSFDLKIEHFARLVSLTQREPTYNPNEQELQVGALQNRLAQMREANTRVLYASSAAETARRRRDDILYDEKTGICTRAHQVKMYVKSALGAASAAFKKINRIPFKVIRKK